MAKELDKWKQRKHVADKKFETIKPDLQKYRDYYRGRQWSGRGDKGSYTDKIVDNMVFANTRIIIPRLSFKNPKIFVTPNKKPYPTREGVFDTIAASAVYEAVLNYYYRKLKIKRETRKCLIDAMLGHWGIMELGYTLETEKVKGNELLEVNELINGESVYAVRRSPFDFRFDPEAMDSHLNDARWIALRWLKSLDDVKKNPRYENTRYLKTNFSMDTTFGKDKNALETNTRTERDYEDDPDLWNRVEGWDVWDKKERRLMTIVEGHDKFLRNEKSWPLDLEGFPTEILYFNENPDEVFPVPEIDIYIDMQDELNSTASMQLSHIKRISQRKYVTQENAFNESEKLKLTHGGDGTIIETAMNPETAIVPLKDATISQDIYINRNMLKNDIRQMAGVSSTEALAGQKFDQATEPALIEQSVQTIREDQREIFEDFIVRIVAKMGAIIQQTATEEQSIPLGEEQFVDMSTMAPNRLEKIVRKDREILLPWLNFSSEDIAGEYDFEIEVGSTQPINEETRKRDVMSLSQIFAGSPYIKQREAHKRILEAFKEKDIDRLLKTDEEVGQEMQQQAQMQQQMELMPDQMKQQTDLTKTQAKNETTLQVAAGKERSASEATRGKLLGDILKTQAAARKKAESKD